MNGIRSLVWRILWVAFICLVMAGSLFLSHQPKNAFPVPSYWLLAMLSCVVAIPLKTDSFIVLPKVLAAYLMAMSVDYTSGVYWRLAENLQIAVGLPISASVVLAAWVAPRRIIGENSFSEPAITAVVIVVAITALLFTVSLLVHSWYGFGAERSLAVFGQLAMVLLVAGAAWRLAGDVVLRIAIGVAGIVAYFWMSIS